jgi:uncharacterized protein (TIGR02099 family)
LPEVFEEALVPLDLLSLQAQWTLDGEQISVQIPNLKFSNADGQGEAQINWRTSDPAASAGHSRFPGVLDMQGSMSRVEGTRVHRYLPSLMLKEVREYVREAVVKGTASGLKFKVKGDLYDMPFTEARHGEFRISTPVNDVTLAYVPRSVSGPDSLPWPEVTGATGELLIDRMSLRTKVSSGRVGGAAGLQIIKAEGYIPDLLNNPSVNLTAEARGGLGSALNLVNGSPLGAMVGHALKQTSATGQGDLRLKMSLPLANLEKTTVQGSVTLGGNDISLAPGTPGLTRARGVLSFTEAGFTVSNVQGRLLGGDIRLDGGSLPTPASGSAAGVVPAASKAALAPAPALTLSTLPVIVVRAQGTLSADGLRQAKELGPVARLAQLATGSAVYNATFSFRKGVPEIGLNSNLVGMALNLPAPLQKTADASLPIRFDNSLLPTSPAGRMLDQLQLDVGRIAAVSYVRDVSGNEPRVMRGSIAVGLAADESAPMPPDSVVANVNLAQIDVDAWQAVLSQLDAPGSSSTGEAQAYLPTTGALRTRELRLGGRKLTNLVVGGSRDGATWRANVDAAELNGYAEYRQGAGASPGRVYARLARLTLAASSAKEMEVLLDEQPATIPALDIVVDDFDLRGKRLGRVEIDAINRSAQGGSREWRLNKFNLTMPEASFTATGNWASLNAQAQGSRPAAERRRTVMNFKFDVADAGELLNRLGMKDVIRRGKGKLEGHIAWVGSPLSLDYPSLGGAFTVGFEAGQFLKADPGIAKLLGVLSLQSLPRRLALDFRDVFSEGFSFDFVRGDVTIEQGLARTNNLQMKGVNAAVLMDGQADIAKETQDMRVIVVPEINAGTASLIATAINPAIGLGTFLAQFVLRGPLMETATQEFRVDGTWVDPRVTKVPHKSPATADKKQETPR